MLRETKWLLKRAGLARNLFLSFSVLARGSFDLRSESRLISYMQHFLLVS